MEMNEILKQINEHETQLRELYDQFEAVDIETFSKEELCSTYYEDSDTLGMDRDVDHTKNLHHHATRTRDAIRRMRRWKRLQTAWGNPAYILQEC